MSRQWNICVVSQVRKRPDAPWWKVVLWSPIYLLLTIAKCFGWLFPSPERKVLMPKISYLQIVDNNWRVASGAFIALFLTGYWCWLAEQNLLIATKTFWSILLVSASLLNALNFSGPLRRFVSVFWSFLFRTPVLIGDLDDPRNEVLAVSMAIHARAKKIKMVMIHRHGVLRAYFKNDEEAVLIRASS